MKYLKRYNEAHWAHWENPEINDLTGYTYSQLKEIFELNLEDNGEFDLENIELGIEHFNNTPIITISLSENFSYTTLQLYLNKSSHSLNCSITAVNKKLLTLIGKKYDLDISNIILARYNDDSTYEIRFNIKKIN